MDSERFDRLTRRLAAQASRRGLLRGIVGGIAATIALRGGDAEARPHSVWRGGVCLRVRQCYNDYIPPRGAGFNPDLQVVYCAFNGFSYDGEFNCCRYEGGFCDRDEECCGFRSCINRFCGFPEWAYR